MPKSTSDQQILACVFSFQEAGELIAWPETLSFPPLHPMERGRGEVVSAIPKTSSCSPSPLVERGLGGEVRDHDCFRAGTLIKTQNGWRPIETIRPGDFVWTHRARLRRVLGIQSHTYVGPILGLRLQTTSVVVWCTPEQQFLSLTGPYPPAPSPQAERGSRTEESSPARLTPGPPLHPMERGSEKEGHSAGAMSPQAQVHSALGGLNPALTQLARELRREATRAEERLWQFLRSRRLNGFKFRRQHPLGPHYIADFYCAEARLAVELDGKVHDSPNAQWADGIRHRQIEEAGVRILRFRNEKLDADLEGVLEEIAAVCASRLSKLPPPLHPLERGLGGQTASPATPNSSFSPSPSDGEGAGGEADTLARNPSFPPSPLAERGPGGEVWQPLKNLRPGDRIILNELGHSSNIAAIDRTVTREILFALTVHDDHSCITEAGVAHNHSFTIPDLLSNEDLRLREFPVARDRIFLAHAGVCPLPRRVTEAVATYAAQAGSDDQEQIVYPMILSKGRALAAQLLHCRPEEVAFVGPTSLGLSLIAGGLKFRKGENILIYFEDYPSNVYPWLALAQQGVEVRLMNTRGLGVIRPMDVLGQVDENTRLVALASCHFISGYRIDFEGIGKELRRRGILFCLDAIQTLGAFPTPVDHVDFLAADAHKWLLGPCGAGLLYVRRELQERLNPPIYGWHNVRCPDFVAQEQITFRTGAAKYEAGSHNLLGLVGLVTALELILEVGVENIARELLQKRAFLLPALQAAGCVVLQAETSPENASAIISFHRPGADPAALQQKFLDNGIVTSLRADRAGQKYTRLSPHFYNTDAELDRVIKTLARI